MYTNWPPAKARQATESDRRGQSTGLPPSLDRDDELAAGVIGGETGKAIDAGG